MTPHFKTTKNTKEEVPLVAGKTRVVIYDGNGEYSDKEGVFVDFDVHNEDGDFYGIRFPDCPPTMIVYFWRKDFAPISDTEKG